MKLNVKNLISNVKQVNILKIQKNFKKSFEDAKKQLKGYKK